MIEIQLAASCGEPPPRLMIKSHPCSCKAATPSVTFLQVGFGSTSLKMTYSIPSVSSGFKTLGKMSLPSMYLSVTKSAFL